MAIQANFNQNFYSIMKNIRLLTSIAFAFVMFLSFNAEAQKFRPLDKSPMDAASFPVDWRNANKAIKIVYSRPQLKERPLSELAPNGKVWRLGANEAAELHVYTDMMLGDSAIDKGVYTVHAIPGDKEWTVIISKQLNIWGSYFYEEDKDVARITVPVTMADESLEAFSIAFESADGGIHMHMGWDKVRVAVPFTKNKG